MAAVQRPTETTATLDSQIDALADLLMHLGWDEGTRVNFNVLDNNTWRYLSAYLPA